MRARYWIAAISTVGAVLLAPVLAFGNPLDWWSPDERMPAPAGEPVIVAQGVWREQPWTLRAYVSVGEGVCIVMTAGEGGTADGQGTQSCGPLGSIGPPAWDASGPHGVTYLIGRRVGLPDYIVGATTADVERVSVLFANGRTDTFEPFAPSPEIDDLRFYAGMVPCGISVLRVTAVDRDGKADSLTPLDSTDGEVCG